MKAFLEQVADRIYADHKGHLEDVSVILPNRRAALFIGRYLSGKAEKPIWSPRFYSIEDFVFKMSGYQLIPLVDLIFELYNVHQEIEGPKSHTFDRFNGWGQLLLKDFNDLDLYLKDSEMVFKYLSEAKALTLWELDAKELTSMERDYLNFYASLGKYYSLLISRLKNEKLAYQGMAYRFVAENINSLEIENAPIVFAGFNALTPSEEVLFDFFEKRGKTTVLWDIDKYYFDNKHQEAGSFLRKQLKNIDPKEISYLSNNLLTDSKNISIYGVSGDVSIAKMAGNILDDLASDKSTDKLSDETAVVLANEQLIVPVLYSLPENIDTFNITMSYPSRLSRVYDLVIIIFDLYLQHFSSDGKPQKNPSFYYKQLESLLLHPLIQYYISKISNSNIDSVIVSDIRKNNISFIDVNKFPLQFVDDKEDDAVRFLQLFAKKIESTIDLVDLCTHILSDLFDSAEEEKVVMDKEFLFHYLNLMRRLHDLLSDNPVIEHILTLKKLFISLASAQGISFSGEPLIGVQIMGMLETRSLDFENLILLSVNEGMLPKSHVYQSFILPDIKRELGLPLPVDNDSVFAYHFYRLIQRAKNVHLIYNTQNDSMGQGELSRYVKQLEWELKDLNPKINMEHKMYHIPLSPEEYSTEIHFPKDEFAISKMKQLAEKGFSPSTLNNYKGCSLKFYFQRVLGMYQEDEVEENIAANTQGSVIHGVLEDFYTEIKSLALTSTFLDKMENTYKDKLKYWFTKEFKEGNIDQGQNLLMRKVAERFIENFIVSERAVLDKNETCTIIDLELEMNREVKVKFEDELITVKLKGLADRIDRIGSDIRVIDYKTGAVNDKDVSLHQSKGGDQWDKMFEGGKDKAFQLMMYAWLYEPLMDKKFNIQAGIIGLKYHSKYFPLTIGKDKEQSISNENMIEFEEDLKTLIEGMFDVSVDFSQCEDKEPCLFCDYKFICGRWEN